MCIKVGIICAGDVELAPFLSMIETVVISKKAMLTFYEGTIHEVKVVALFCGVCKVNAALATQIIIDTYKVDVVINAGTAGAIHPKLEIFDTIIVAECAYHDVESGILTEFHPWMESIYFRSDGQLIELTKRLMIEECNKTNCYWGRMMTGESFIVDEQREVIKQTFQPLGVDMETASIAHVCYVNQIPFIAIRSITDTATHKGVEVFEQNCQQASEISMRVVVSLLDAISEYKKNDD